MVNKDYEVPIKFVLAGISNMTGATVTNPIDVIKIRLQLDSELATSAKRYKGMLRGGYRIVTEEGFAALYKGLSASLLRESSYSTIRLGAYEPFKKLYGATDPAHTALWRKILAGASSGTIGSIIATPADLVKVRQQAQHGADGAGGTWRCLCEIYSAGGAAKLYVGIGPTVCRAAILTATQIPSYDHSKHTLLNAGLLTEGPLLHVVSSMCAGFMAALTTSPMDVVKTRIMNQRTRGLYKNAFDCFAKTYQAEGVRGFYKGFVPNWMRVGPHTIVTFFIFEQLRHLVGIAPI